MFRLVLDAAGLILGVVIVLWLVVTLVSVIPNALLALLILWLFLKDL